MEEGELCFPQINTSCWKPQRPHSHTVIIYIVLSFISLLTVTLNLLVIISISHFKQLYTPTNLLLLSLGVSDFFVGLNMSNQIMLTGGCWWLSDVMCSLYFVVDYVATSTSIGIMVLISIDRYVAICYPLHYSTKVTPNRVQLCVLLCWICSFIYTCIVLKDDLKQPGRFKSCIGECVFGCDVIHQMADFIVLFLFPLTVIVILYMRVFVVAVSQARAMRSSIGVVQHQCSVTAKKSEMKAARTLGVVIVIFIICICPYFCVTVTGQDSKVGASSASAVLLLYECNSCLNPLVYAFFYPWFRKSIRHIVTLKILKPGSCDTNIL